MLTQHHTTIDFSKLVFKGIEELILRNTISRTKLINNILNGTTCHHLVCTHIALDQSITAGNDIPCDILTK